MKYRTLTRIKNPCLHASYLSKKAGPFRIQTRAINPNLWAVGAHRTTPCCLGRPRGGDTRSARLQRRRGLTVQSEPRPPLDSPSESPACLKPSESVPPWLFFPWPIPNDSSNSARSILIAHAIHSRAANSRSSSLLPLSLLHRPLWLGSISI